MTPELSSPAAMAALPVRRREILEILDTALKLYRRYFWVLIGWSALISLPSLVPIVQWLAFFATPLLFGAVSCCVAAAVRGQSVKFSQCWAFTKPRYGPLLGTILLSYLVLIGVFFAITLAGILIGLLGAWALSNAPQPLQIVGTIGGVVLGMVVVMVMSVGAFGWMTMVPVVVCLEDDKRSSAAMGRAFDLLKGNWRRVFGLSLILGLAVIAVFTLVGVIYAIVVGTGGLLSSNPSQSAIMGAATSIAGVMGLFFMIWNPVQTLVIAVLYLDLRVRREALDLEWTAYSTTPAAPPSPNFAPLESTPPDAALRDGSPYGDAAPNSPASFGAGAGEPANPYLAPTPFAPQNTAPPQAQVAPETFSSAPDVTPLAENISLTKTAIQTTEVPVNSGFAPPVYVGSSPENVSFADPVAPSVPTPINNFTAPDDSPLTSSFSPPTALDNTPTPSTNSSAEPLSTEVPGGENEARRD